AARRIHPTDVVLSLASAAALGYVFVDFEGFIYRAVVPTTWDLVFGVLTILLILEATRRSVGNALLVVVGGFILYAFAGPWGPSPIRCCRKPDTTVSRPAGCCRPAALAPSSPRPSSEPPRS